MPFLTPSSHLDLVFSPSQLKKKSIKGKMKSYLLGLITIIKTGWVGKHNSGSREGRREKNANSAWKGDISLIAPIKGWCNYLWPTQRVKIILFISGHSEEPKKMFHFNKNEIWTPQKAAPLMTCLHRKRQFLFNGDY